MLYLQDPTPEPEPEEEEPEPEPELPPLPDLTIPMPKAVRRVEPPPLPRAKPPAPPKLQEYRNPVSCTNMQFFTLSFNCIKHLHLSSTVTA